MENKIEFKKFRNSEKDWNGGGRIGASYDVIVNGEKAFRFLGGQNGEYFVFSNNEKKFGGICRTVTGYKNAKNAVFNTLKAAGYDL